MANYLGLKNKFFPNLRQYEATTGRPISDRAMQNYLYAALQTEADRADQRYWREKQFGLQQQGLDIQKQAYADQARAAKIGGITQLASLPMQGFLGYKVLQKSGLIGGGAQAIPSGVGAQVLSEAAKAGIDPSVAFSSLKATGQIASDAALPTSGGGLLGTGTGTLSSMFLPASVGAVGGKLLSDPLDKVLPGGGKTGQFIAGAAGGALTGWAAGALAGSSLGPVGAIVGGIFGGIASLF